MQTYYQKHKQIKAFQFNGTLTQLREELTDEQMAQILCSYLDHKRFPDDDDDQFLIHFDQQNYIDQLRLTPFQTGFWPAKQTNLPMLDEYGQQIIDHHGKKRYAPNDIGLTLKANMYITPQFWIYTTKFDDEPYGINRAYRETHMGLKFYRSNDFKTHWNIKRM